VTDIDYNTTTIDVCDCCMYQHAIGECGCDDHDHEPWSDLDPKHSVAMGISPEDHANDCTGADRDAGCECEIIPFSNWPCDGCGSPLSGARHKMTLFINDRV
jgi:hypothetical protein